MHLELVDYRIKGIIQHIENFSLLIIGWLNLYCINTEIQQIINQINKIMIIRIKRSYIPENG
jgi:hypothetical protein